MSEQRLAYGRAQLDRAATTEDGPLIFTASSTAVNRYGFSLRTEGWRLENFRANPVILWAHNASAPPIGKGTVDLEGARLRSAVEFDREDKLAVAVESKYRRGFLSAVSVGFDFVDDTGAQLAWWRLSSDQIRDEAFYDLAEISAVPVPADPKALVEQQKFALGHLGRELVDLFEETQDPASTITKADLNAAVAAELARLGIDLAHLAPGEPATGISQDAARALFAAFDLSKEENPQ